MSEHDAADSGAAPRGPFGYAACPGCGVAVRRCLLADGHECDPERYAAHQASRLHWQRRGFDDALGAWLASPAGRFAQFCARRLLDGPGAVRPGEA
jgi:hypothetical protein